MKNVSEIEDCFGCGVCAASCSRRLIDLRYNGDGFFTPYIENNEDCTACGLCVSVCSFINEIPYLEPKHSYAAWSKDSDVRKRSSSGGLSFELAKMFIQEGFLFCGVRYNLEKQRAEHYIARKETELLQSVGSKYLQSYTVEAFQSINRSSKTLIVGTPCQMASFRRYIQKFKCEQNFLLVDFFCHGVPSMLMWKRYLKENAKGIGDIKAVSWRNKSRGWRNSYCICLEGTKKTVQSWKGKDSFFTLFLGNACLNKACYDNCKFKFNQSSADIRIGDYWSSQFKENQYGVSAAIAFSEIGEKALKNANIHLEEYSFEQVAKGQMKKNSIRPWYYGITMKMIKDGKALSTFCIIIRFSNRLKVYFNRIKKKIKE